MTVENDDKAAARHLAGLAHRVAYDPPEREPWREFVQRISRGRFGRPQPWQDTDCWERRGWRTRAADLNGQPAFSVDYRVCRRCGLGWVEWPDTLRPYRRCGLASAGLTELRAKYPDLAWHTLGGHIGDSAAFWDAIGADVPGGYRQREPCPHVTRG